MIMCAYTVNVYFQQCTCMHIKIPKEIERFKLMYISKGTDVATTQSFESNLYYYNLSCTYSIYGKLLYASIHHTPSPITYLSYV